VTKFVKSSVNDDEDDEEVDDYMSSNIENEAHVGGAIVDSDADAKPEEYEEIDDEILDQY
jgi:hypothetical protein